MRDDDVGGLRRCHLRVESLERQDRGGAADDLGDDEATEAGAMPAKLLENMRPNVIAGLAKLAELVKK